VTRGFTVDWVSTGGEALERMRPVDGPVADVDLGLGLPDGDRLGRPRHATRERMCDASRRRHGEVRAADRARASALGVDGYLINQFSIAELLARLQHAPTRR
jgi:DNA-binding response OmpR family regulator